MCKSRIGSDARITIPIMIYSKLNMRT